MLSNVPTSRRQVLLALGAAAGWLATGPSFAQSLVAAEDLGLVPDSGRDDSASFTAALARANGRPLMLAPGEYRLSNARIPPGTTLLGAGARILATGGVPALTIAGNGVILDGLQFVGSGSAGSTDAGLVAVEASSNVRIRGCAFAGFGGDGVRLNLSDGAIQDCLFTGLGGAGVFSIDSNGLLISGNRISETGNGGILVWGSENRHDGSIIAKNSIRSVRADGGGNGQNGNGINVFRCDGVIVADNQIADCAFTAVRLNSTNNTQVSGNVCRNSGEVAIFSEFAFSGSIVADNIVDNAAAGISITNWDSGGHLATCSGNIVRNIQPRSLVNPDTTPYGIAAEADVAVTGNAVEGVPGPGIIAGWGPFLRDVVVSGNMVREVDIGVAVSVADGAGAATVTGNLISEARVAAIAGMAWTEIQSDDLARDGASYPGLTISGNTVA